MRPGAGALAARSDGARKNTRLSRNANSASAVAEPRPRPQASSNPEAAALAGHRMAWLPGRRARGSIAASRRCAVRMRRKAATRERARDQHAERIGRDDVRQVGHAGASSCPRHQQGADAPLHHRGAGPRNDDGGEHQRVAERGEQQRPQHADIHGRRAGEADRGRLMQRVPPVDAELDDRQVHHADQRQDGAGAVAAHRIVEGAHQGDVAEIQEEQHQHRGQPRVPHPPGAPHRLAPDAAGERGTAR